ncbi:MAG: hypothetical protein DI566_07755 [Microbacterium sp.]|nr:MAG: hypothetical protein DI566_07755 [Microbacterium sp.]
MESDDPTEDAGIDSRLDSLERSVREITALQIGLRDEMRSRWREEDALLRLLVERAEVQIETTRRDRDRITELRQRLERFRLSDDYERLWDDPTPLVSVRIASYQNTDALVETAIESVLRQTYQNFEIVVVNDGPNPRTRAAIMELRDDRIRYEETPARGDYPTDAHLRWMVAGSPAMNHAARLARGVWIAPLDDDDEFVEDHLEKLVSLARRERAELAYGALIQRDKESGVDRLIHSDPPQPGQFSFQSVIYAAALRFFEYDTESWRVGEPGDWNLVRRMSLAGVRMASTPDIHAIMNFVRFDRR